jgi:antitoxin (DNA-binding transcriptional repressor) of toxin-antitoxin stability system
VLTKTISIRDAQANLREWVKRALQGDEIIIADADMPPVRLVPLVRGDQPRVAGLNQGQIWTSDDFDQPLPDKFWTGSQ